MKFGESFGKESFLPPFFHIDFCTWLLDNLRGTTNVRTPNWSQMFGIALDRIWWRMNEFIFGQKWIMSSVMVNNINALIHDLQRAKEGEFMLLQFDDIGRG